MPAEQGILNIDGKLTKTGGKLQIENFKIAINNIARLPAAPVFTTCEPFPGFKPIPLGRDDECMRLSVACVIGIEPIHIQWVIPEGDYLSWFLRWQEVCYDLGWRLTHTYTAGKEAFYEPSGLWIGIVHARQTRTRYHALVMKGPKLYYDCARKNPRKQRPHKLLGAYYLNPLPSA
jgi:hypothetical protein